MFIQQHVNMRAYIDSVLMSNVADTRLTALGHVQPILSLERGIDNDICE